MGRIWETRRSSSTFVRHNDTGISSGWVNTSVIETRKFQLFAFSRPPKLQKYESADRIAGRWMLLGMQCGAFFGNFPLSPLLILEPNLFWDTVGNVSRSVLTGNGTGNVCFVVWMSLKNLLRMDGCIGDNAHDKLLLLHSRAPRQPRKRTIYVECAT